MGFDQLSNMWTAVFPLAVLLYYFFRKKYVTTTISSTLFWEKSMRETKVSPYLKNLQRNALFYLQMAAFLLFLFILLGPFLPKESVPTSHTVFIVDTSASMGATVGELSLFESNKEKIQELAEQRAGSAISIITTGKEPSLLVRKETDERAVLAAINQLDMQYEHEHMARSIDFAKSIALQDGADVHIFTDFLDRSVFMESENGITWTVHTNEKPLANIAIEKFGAVATMNGTEAIVKLSNQSTSKQPGKMIIKNGVTGETLSEQDFFIDAGADLLLSFKELPTVSAIRAVLQVQDDYPTDNEALILIGNASSEVIVDSQLHELVKKAFEAIGLTVTTGSVSEMEMARDQAILVTNDPSFLREGTEPILLMGRNDSSTEPVSGMVQTVNDSLFTIASIKDIYVSALYPPFEGYATLATVDGKPFIQRSQRGDIVVLSDIALTDWPLHPSFPLFIWSSAEMLRSGSDNVGAFIPNERKAVLTSGSEGIEIFTTEDKYVASYPDGGSFVAPSKPGIYKMIDGGTEKYFSVQLELGEKIVSHGSGYKQGFVETDDAGKEEGKNMIGWLFLLPVLLLLLIEWEVQRRRGYPN
ncbi:vWA domain-containing protein [Sporosarcina highlanderae]|uniref:BatA and WFA domain-containing protein n=1 Tax=Sporosarcina highlanderae TaxID=3035916 RepID=A0ABT8JWL6_9BACL|nr:BatA and WFA domain-containing protein [Sporosarcina highlanderae]MDN4608956.1 BatA and WFA domain-containing protein [Sporosarcina highlanderae]